MLALKPYPKYKDTKLEWLGNIPEKWEVKRGKTIFNCIDTRSLTGEEELLTVSSKNGVIPRKSTTVTMFKADSYIGYKMCWPNDLVINSLWAWAGGLGVANNHGIISSAYGVYRLKETANTSSNFIHELVRSTPFHWELKVRSKGIWTSRLQLTDQSFLDTPFPVPPLVDQKFIIRYLNYTNFRLTKYIAAKQKLIKLLEEQKKSIIHQAVTGTIDVRTGKPYSKYKDSGIEWLGQIPEEWEVDKLKRSISQCVNGIWGNDPDKENDIFCVRVADFNYKLKQVQLDKMTFRSITNNERVGRLLKEGDLLLEKSGGGDLQPVGRVVIYNHDIPAVCSNFIAKVRISKKYNAMFICYLHSLLYSVGLNIRSIKQTTGIQNLDSRSYFNEVVAYPSLQEQFAISQFIENKLGKIDSTIDRTKKEIVLLKEYRTRLTADVVTGKVDVREIAKNLPEEIATSLELVDDEVEEIIPDEQQEPTNEEN